MSFKYGVLLTFLVISISVSNAQDEKFKWGKILKTTIDDESLERSFSNEGQEKWFEQRLDHFHPQNQKTWKQRYFIHSEFFDQKSKSSPVFLEIGGEGTIDMTKFVNSHMANNLARDFKAYSIQVEHRFYGYSQPFKNWSTENLEYLTSEQALADLANFIVQMNNTKPELQNRPWIVFGGSYAGALSAWMHLKYPHLIQGAIASSAPVQAQLDFPEYFEVVSESLGAQCSYAVKKAFEDLEKLTQSSASIPSLKKQFNLCDLELSEEKTRQNFISTITDLFAGVVQYNEDNRKGSNVTIDMICDIMVDQSESNEQDSSLRKLGKIFKLINQNEKECNDVSYSKMIADLQNTTINFAEGGRQWTYQTCNEFGYYQTTTSPNQPFTKIIDLKFYTDMCSDVYGKKFDETYIRKAIERTNMMYGARNLIATKVFLINGSIDPWHALSLLDYQHYHTTTKYIKGTAHCADMYPPSPHDKPDLVKAREIIRERISTFLYTR